MRFKTASILNTVLFKMTLKYLSLEDAKLGLLTELPADKIPEDTVITAYLTRLEVYLEHWLSRCLKPTLYREIGMTNCQGDIATREYPLLVVVDVNYIAVSDIVTTDAAQAAKAIDPKTEGIAEFERHQGTTYRNSEYVIETGIAEAYVELT